jgi:hypothetical protein
MLYLFSCSGGAWRLRTGHILCCSFNWPRDGRCFLEETLTAREPALRREKMSKPKKDKAQCGGCYNNDYNFGLGGSNECWSFKSAKIIKRLAIHVDQPPPYNKDNAEYRMDCFNSKRMVYVKPDALTSEGYWKS